MMPQIFAELPDLGYVIVGCVVLCVFGAVGLMYVMRVIREVRTGLAEELKRELAAEKEPVSVAVQQPLIMKPHEGFTPLEKHEELVERVDGLKEEMNERLAGVSGAASEGREKIYHRLGALEQGMAASSEKTDLTYAQVQNLDGKIDRILAQMPRRHDS